MYYHHQQASASRVIHAHFIATIFLLSKQSPSRWADGWPKYVEDDTLVHETIVVIVYIKLLIIYQFKCLSATVHSTHSAPPTPVLWNASFLYSKMKWEARCEQQIKGLEWNIRGMLYVLTNMPQSHGRTRHNEWAISTWHAAPCPCTMYVQLPPSCYTEHHISPCRWRTAQWNTQSRYLPWHRTGT